MVHLYFMADWVFFARSSKHPNTPATGPAPPRRAPWPRLKRSAAQLLPRHSIPLHVPSYPVGAD